MGRAVPTKEEGRRKKKGKPLKNRRRAKLGYSPASKEGVYPVCGALHAVSFVSEDELVSHHPNHPNNPRRGTIPILGDAF